MKDSLFLRTKVPMTKEEVRAITLDKLDLRGAKRFLDVGSGTGSVSIQAALEFPDLEVLAIEKNPAALEISQQNFQLFQCQNIQLMEGLAPIPLEGKFDAVFVGGSGGNLQEILSWAQELLVPGGRLGLNFILIENALEAMEYLEQLDFVEVDMISIQASRWTGLGKGHYFKPQNPTLIISCRKKEEVK